MFLLTERESGSRNARHATLCLAVFPTAYFLHIASTESIFLCLAIGAFYYARGEGWLMCGLFGMFATASRILAVAIIPALAVEYFQQKSFHWREIRWNAAFLALLPLGLAAYFAINYHYTGDPIYFLHVERERWFHYLRWPVPSLRNWDGVMVGNALDRVDRYAPQLIAFAIASAGVIAAFQMRLCYAVYLALSWVMFFAITFLSPRRGMSLPNFRFSCYWHPGAVARG